LRNTRSRLANVMRWSHDDHKRNLNVFVDIYIRKRFCFRIGWRKYSPNVNVASVSHICEKGKRTITCDSWLPMLVILIKK